MWILLKVALYILKNKVSKIFSEDIFFIVFNSCSCCALRDRRSEGVQSVRQCGQIVMRHTL